MVQVIIEFYVPELGRTVEVPVFTGPVTGFKRKRATVTMQAAGKDIFARKSWPRLTIPKGTNYVDMIRNILRELGETKFKFTTNTTTTARLTADKVIDRNSEISPWGECRRTASGLSMRLFYDGAGYAVLRERSDDVPVFEFKSGVGGTVLTEPTTDGDYSRIANIVRAESTDPENTKAVWEETVPPSSPIHPTRLTRGGKPLYLGVVVQRDSITTQSDAKSAARSELKDRQYAAYRVDFDAVPLWMLEETDPIQVSVDNVVASTLVLQFALALKPAVMPVGYTDLVAPTLARIRRF
jgi:hypothetical protein